MISILFYDLGIWLYKVSVYVASLFSQKAKSWIGGRKKLNYRLRQYISSAHGPKIWIHCASLGEFEQARPLIEKIRGLHPEYKLILTFFSPSGFEVRKKYDGVDFISYLPLDTANNARRFVRRMKPSLVIWVKYEFWYHTLKELYEERIPVVLISSVFRENHIFFKWYGGLHRKMLGYFYHIFVQNITSQEQLKHIGISSEVCSDTRFDSVYNVMNKPKLIDSIGVFKGDKKIFIAGSTWDKDADVLCEMINADPFDGQYKYILVPHDVSRPHIDYLVAKINKKKAVMSRLNIENAGKFDVLIVDNIGLLSSLYYYGTIAYVGGGFGAGIHNILEPAVYGMPVIFGPHYHKSEEAKALLSHKDWHAAFSIKNTDELTASIRSLIANDAENLKTGSERSKAYVLQNTGGADMIYQYLKDNKMLPEIKTSSHR